jgi:hypothetical protein
MKNNYPEHEKLKNIQEESELCAEFLEWLQYRYDLIDRHEKFEEHYVQRGYSSPINKEKLLAEFFDIDLSEIEKEKQKMIEELR